MDQEAEARSEYIKFFILLFFFGALTIGAAMLRPIIQGGVQAPPTTETSATSTLPMQIMATPAVTPVTEPTNLPSPTPIITPTVTTPAVTIEPQTYKVQAGDNLFRIGQQFGLTVDELMAANQITDRHLIRVGQVLTIPEAGTPPSVYTYVVQWGDTLWEISRTFGVEIEALIAANDISDPSKIRAGQVLEIPR